MNASNMRREFVDRNELVRYLQEQFSDASDAENPASETVGGRKAAEERLMQIDPPRYAQTRNALDGAVTGLAPYIRHGVVSLAEVRDAALAAVRRPVEASKLVQELAWRDYWQRVYAQLGDSIWQDREAYKTGFVARQYAAELPEDLAEGETGLACIDAFSNDLRTTGYLHNHTRMWLAAYLVHWQRVRWQVGARWFLEHLLDGDPASNNLSWQWVASTFSHKPYYFNRDNLERYTNGQYCRNCALATNGECPFEASYEQLAEELFPDIPAQDRQYR
jgi:deoxyribodipyrimidine photo-lyase